MSTQQDIATLQKNGHIVMKALNSIQEPVTLLRLVNRIAEKHNLNPGQIKDSVKAVLQTGLDTGFIMRNNGRYSVCGRDITDDWSDYNNNNNNNSPNNNDVNNNYCNNGVHSVWGETNNDDWDNNNYDNNSNDSSSNDEIDACCPPKRRKESKRHSKQNCPKPPAPCYRRPRRRRHKPCSKKPRKSG